MRRAPDAVWTGGFVRHTVGIEVATDPSRSLIPVELLVGVALRRNPKRAHLLVSNVLAKHVPTVPGLAIVAGELLGVLVGDALDAPGAAVAKNRDVFERLTGILQATGERDAAGERHPDGERDAAIIDDLAALRSAVAGLRSRHPDVVTIGYAETATGLGHLVAATIGSYYVHSTRHAPAGARPFAGFEEEHSHATSHQLYPTDGGWLRPGATVVLVDDELSTGTTIVNTISALHAVAPQSRWVVATLIDLRSAADRARFDALAATLGTSIAVVALGAGSIALGPDVIERAAAVLTHAASEPSTPAGEPQAEVVILDVTVEPLRSARFGLDLSASHTAAHADTIARRIADAIRPQLRHGRTLVLGSEEFIALPLAVADHLDRRAAESDDSRGSAAGRGSATGRGIAAADCGTVRFSTTTRSPINAIDRLDYAIASALTFESHDLTTDGFGPRFAYNLNRSGSRFDTIVLLPEPAADRDRMLAPDGVVESLRRAADRVIVAYLPESTPAPREWTPLL